MQESIDTAASIMQALCERCCHGCHIPSVLSQNRKRIEKALVFSATLCIELVQDSV